jgi:hypothetical protein
MLCVVDDARDEALDGHAAWSESFNEMFMQVAGAFSNASVRRRGRAYVLGLLSRAERKNSWQLAEFAGDASPDGMQRLLNFSPWDEDAVRDALARYVARAMGDPAAVLAVDETGFLKKGRMSAGVARMYTGTAGRVENCQVGVFAAYVTPDGGRALIDRELYLPEKWADDRDRCRAAGIGDDVGFATKPGLARRMIERAAEAGVPFSWVAGDEVYGGNPKLRAWLEGRGISYVMAVACSEMIAMAAGGMRADDAAGLVPEGGWQRLSCADGSKGPRLYDWALIGAAAPGHRLLPLLVAPPGHPARARRRGGGALGSGGLLRGGERGGRAGPLPGPQVPGLVPARHPVDARARVPRRHRPRLQTRHRAHGKRERQGRPR